MLTKTFIFYDNNQLKWQCIFYSKLDNATFVELSSPYLEHSYHIDIEKLSSLPVLSPFPIEIIDQCIKAHNNRVFW